MRKYFYIKLQFFAVTYTILKDNILKYRYITTNPPQQILRWGILYRGVSSFTL